MLSIEIFALLAGAVLGWRYKVASLIPGILLAVPFVIVVAHAEGETAGRTTVYAVLAILALELGYFLGCGLRVLALRRRMPQSLTQAARGPSLKTVADA